MVVIMTVEYESDPGDYSSAKRVVRHASQELQFYPNLASMALP